MASRVLAIGDTHCPAMHKKYPAFLTSIAKKHKCNEFVFIGDVVDHHAISFHEKNPHLPSSSDECKQARKQVAELYSRFPKAHWLLGNHDVLPARQMAKAGLSADFLKDYKDIWGVPNWTIHPRFHCLRIDGCDYMHGDAGKTRQFAAAHTARARFRSTISGHCHCECGIWYYANGDSLVFGCNTGTGIDWRKLQFEYGRKFVGKPIVSCAVIIDGVHPVIEVMPL